LKPEGAVFVVEGEKACDALRALVDGSVVTWNGGTSNVLKADWAPIAGRDVVLWADADPVGIQCMIGGVISSDNGEPLPPQRHKKPLAVHLHSLGCKIRFLKVKGRE
jgi:hypothetical protein